MDDNLQIDNGNYTRIHNRTLEELAKIKLSGYETRIIFALWRKTYGWRKKEDFIPFKQFEEITKLPKSEISRTLTRLKKRNLVVETYNSNRRIYRFNKHFTTWKRVVENYNSCRKLHKELEKTTTTVVENYNKKSLESKPKEKQPAPKETLKRNYTKESIVTIFSFWKEILNHPRAILSKDRMGWIKARLKEGHTIEDCKQAIIGCKSSAYHMGDNHNGKNGVGVIYDSIELIFKKGDKLEQFIGYLNQNNSNDLDDIQNLMEK